MTAFSKITFGAQRGAGVSTRDNTPHPVDVHVGQRVRDRRRELRGSQQWLAQHLNLSFQQLQKYERGMNRISASKLYEVAIALDVSVTYFFEGLEGHSVVGTNPAEAAIMAFAASSEGIEILEYFRRLPPKAQKVVTDAVKGLAELPPG